LPLGVEAADEDKADDQRDHCRDQQQRERPQTRTTEGDHRGQRGEDADGTDHQRHPRTTQLNLPDHRTPPQHRLPIKPDDKRLPTLTHRPRIPHAPQRPKIRWL
jgi:hypothetical protein